MDDEPEPTAKLPRWGFAGWARVILWILLAMVLALVGFLLIGGSRVGIMY